MISSSLLYLVSPMINIEGIVMRLLRLQQNDQRIAHDYRRPSAWHTRRSYAGQFDPNL